MKKAALFLALILLLSACNGAVVTPEETSPSPNVTLIPWEGKPSPIPVEPSPIPSPVGPDDIPVPDIERREVPDTEAQRFVTSMAPGINWGNTFDATGSKDLNAEMSWGNPKTTREMINLLKESGLKSFRLPVTWSNHVDKEFTIDAAWLDRVQEVVDYAYSADMTVILNIHHDDGPDYVYPDTAHYETSARYIGRVWGQLAERFRDYDERLVFDGLNEPRLKGHKYEWWQDFNDAVCVDALDTLCKLQQDFVDTVRAAGGYNETRYLMVCGLGANYTSVIDDLYRLPEDTVEDRILVSVHAYIPNNFALQGPGVSGSVSDFDMTSGRRIRQIDTFMDRLYDKFTAAGVPVVLGEFGARDKRGNLRDRTEFTAYYTAAATARGMPCLWWDNGAFTGGGENFGLMDRFHVRWTFPGIVETMVTYAE